MIDVVVEERVMTGAREQVVNVGSTIDLICNIPATPGVNRVQWTRDRGPLPPTAFTSPTQSTLTLVNVQPNDAGRYICKVSSETGVNSDYVLLKVESKLPFRPTPYPIRRNPFRTG
jgi:Immunoglobulin domain